MDATSSFDLWAKGFSGCDGGNLHGQIWLCGVEWGTGSAAHPLAREMVTDVSQPPQLYQASEDVLRSRGGKSYPFNRMFLKLIAAMRRKSVEEYEAIAYETPFPFSRESDFFKLNLLPIAFKEEKAEWTSEYSTLTGLATKEEYVEWCLANRFPSIRSWVREGKPRLVIGVGLGHVALFQSAFGFTGPEMHREPIEGTRLEWGSKEGLILAVVPFATSPSGLNSNRRLQAFGKRLEELFISGGLAVTREVAVGGQRSDGSSSREIRSATTPSRALRREDGWNRTYSEPKSGAQTDYIERALSDVPRTAIELADIANLISGKDPGHPSYVTQKRVTGHLSYHHKTMGESKRRQRDDSNLRMPQIIYAAGLWSMPPSMKPR